MKQRLGPQDTLQGSRTKRPHLLIERVRDGDDFRKLSVSSECTLHFRKIAEGLVGTRHGDQVSVDLVLTDLARASDAILISRRASTVASRGRDKER